VKPYRLIAGINGIWAAYRGSVLLIHDDSLSKDMVLGYTPGVTKAIQEQVTEKPSVDKN
jgi:hypothetical protein